MKILFTIVLLFSTLFAELKIGDAFPNLTLVDQFDKKIEVEKEGSSKVILSFEKDVSLSIKEFLKTQDKSFLEENNITYISDISSLPSLLVGWFVLPKLKELSFRVALIYGDEGKSLNRRDGKVSLFELENGKIVKIEFLETKKLENLSSLTFIDCQKNHHFLKH